MDNVVVLVDKDGSILDPKARPLAAMASSFGSFYTRLPIICSATFLKQQSDLPLAPPPLSSPAAGPRACPRAAEPHGGGGRRRARRIDLLLVGPQAGQIRRGGQRRIVTAAFVIYFCGV